MQIRPEAVRTYFKHTANFRDYLLKDLAEPGFARQYLEVSLENYEEDGDIDMLAHAIRNVVEAQDGIEKLAIQTGQIKIHLCYEEKCSGTSARSDT